MIKILFIGQAPNKSNKGGIGSYINHRAHLLSKNGFMVWWSNSQYYTFFDNKSKSWSDNKKIKQSGFFKRIASKYFYFFTPEWQNAIKNIQPDIIELPDGVSAVLPKNRSEKVIIQCHTSWPVRNFLNKSKNSLFRRIRNKIKIQIQNKVYKQANGILACSHEIAFLESGFHKIHPDKITVLHHYFSKEAEPGLSPQNIDHENYFLVIGNFEYFKGFDLILNAFKHYREIGGKFRLKFAGNEGWSDPLFRKEWSRSRIIKEFRSSDAVNHVDFLGTISKKELSDIRYKATAVIIGSRFEAFTMVAGESFLSSIPLILSDRTGWSRVAGKYNSSVLISPYDTASFGKILLKFEAEQFRNSFQHAIIKTSEYISGDNLKNTTVNYYKNIAI